MGLPCYRTDSQCVIVVPQLTGDGSVNITRNQWFGIVGVILSAMMTSTAFLTDTFGATLAHSIIGTAGFVNMIMNGVVVIITGQGQQIRDVSAMPGVEKITLNENANQAAAIVATDPAQPKVSGTSAAVQQTLKETAKGTS